MPSPSKRRDILCAGEVLWDALPQGLFLGGAPFNVAAHLHALGRPSTLVSRVGNDLLGSEVRRRMHHRGMSTSFVQIDPDLDTGFVRVALDAEGTAEYDILHPVAWDAIAWTEALAERAPSAQAVVFGSLAQRSEPSRHTIQTLCTNTDGLVVYDVNLRPPHTDRPIVETSLRHADVVKLNDEELEQVRRWFDLPSGLRFSAEALANRFSLQACCVTRGGDGAALWRDDRWHTHPGYDVTVADTVGAGDAFLAALLSGLLANTDDERLLDLANRMGAFVASQAGAIPSYDLEGVEEIEQIALGESGRPKES